MKYNSYLTVLILSISSIYPQSISFGVNQRPSPILTIDLLNNLISLDLGCDYSKSETKRNSLDSSWTDLGGNVYGYSFETVWDYSIKTISPSIKFRYSLKKSQNSHPYFYLSMVKPMVDVSGEFFIISNGSVDDLTEERLNELESIQERITYSFGLGISSMLNKKIRLLFDFGYFTNSYDHNSTSLINDDPTSGRISRKEQSDSNSYINASISVLYVF